VTEDVRGVANSRRELVRPARLERATSWFVGQCRGLDSRDFVPVARVDPSCCGVFGFRLFTDCSLRHLQPRLGACSLAGRPLSAYPDVRGLGRADHSDAGRAQRQALRTRHPHHGAGRTGIPCRRHDGSADPSRLSEPHRRKHPRRTGVRCRS